MRTTGASTVIGTFSSEQRFQSGGISGPVIQSPTAPAPRGQPHSAESLLRELRQVVWRSGIQWIHAAHALEHLRILLQRVRQKTVVVPVVNHLNEDGL